MLYFRHNKRAVGFGPLILRFLFIICTVYSLCLGTQRLNDVADHSELELGPLVLVGCHVPYTLYLQTINEALSFLYSIPSGAHAWLWLALLAPEALQVIVCMCNVLSPLCCYY